MIRENFHKIVIDICCFIFILPALCFAQWLPEGIYIGPGTDDDMCPDDRGGVYITWYMPNQGLSDVYLQHVDSAGYKLFGYYGLNITSDTLLFRTTPRIVSDGFGGVYVAYMETENVGGPRWLEVQRVDPDGNLMWGEGGVVGAIGLTSYPVIDIIQDDEGGCIVAFRKHRTNYLQRFSSDGELLWDTSGVLLCYDNDLSILENDAYVIKDLQGSIFAVWQDTRNWDFTETDIYAQKVNMNGEILWDSLGVPVVIYEDDQGDVGGDANILAVSDGEGGIVVVWPDLRFYYPYWSVFTNRLGPDGQSLWDIEGIEVASIFDDYSRSPSLFKVDDKFLYIWSDYDTGTFGQMLDLDSYRQWEWDGRLLSPYAGIGRAYGAHHVQHQSGEYSGVSHPDDFFAIKFDTLGNQLWSDGVNLGFHFALAFYLMVDGIGGMYVLHDGVLQRVYPDGRLGGDTTTAITNNFDGIPCNIEILQNYPNPFNSQTIIKYNVGNVGIMPIDVDIIIYDILGRVVKEIVEKDRYPGVYKVIWNGRDNVGNELTSGVYFVKVKQSEGLIESQSRKIILLR
jgi:hypothetical protein